jgi:Tol biopolymer transport system component/tRNA A-37 threonylcarbamoyl transferase component Bud32
MSLSAGDKLGPYEILAVIGAGGMGEVFKARDARLDRIVAIKTSTAGFSDRFEREARTIAKVNHPNICTLHDVGPDYLVMEYIEGHPLACLIPRKGMPLAEVLNYAAQIADALAAAHAADIVHRDLKPGNVMITAEGRVKVVDFGLARMVVPITTGPDVTTLTQTAEGTIAGTVSYMSPEQAQGKSVDVRSDIFSFGALLYEMLTGRRAFLNDSAMSTLADIINKEPPPASNVTPSLPTDVETLLSRCLRKDPARRCQSMSDVKAALLDVQAGSGPPSPRRRGPAAAAGIGAALLLATGAGWYFARNQPGAAPSMPVPITSYIGFQSYPTFSPDGTQVAFAWNGPNHDNMDIYVKLATEGEPLRLTTDPAAELCPAWSPDGRWIAFSRMLSGARGAVMLISPLGGAARKVGEFSVPKGLAQSISWTGDSKHLVIPIRDELRSGLFLLSIDSGEVRQLTALDPSVADSDDWAAVAPGDRALAFVRVLGVNLGDLMVLDLAPDWSPKGKPRALGVHQVNGPTAWSPDGKDVLYVSASTAPASTIERISASGTSKPRTVVGGSDGAFAPAVSHPASNGFARLAWARRFSDTNIYRLELSGPPDAPTADHPLRIASSVFRDDAAEFSPDGTSIAYASGRSGTSEIWICQADGSNARQLTRMGPHLTSGPKWSPDGKQIAFGSTADGPWQIYVVNAEGGSPKRLSSPPKVSFGARWSPDGRWIYFSSDRSGPQNVWRMPASGGTVEQMTHNGGFEQTVSPDGKFLYFVKGSGGGLSTLWRMPLAGGDEEKVLPALFRTSYQLTGRGIYYPEPRTSTIQFLDLETGKTSVLWHTDKPFDLGMSVSPDRRYLLYSQIDNSGGNLMMIENFR